MNPSDIAAANFRNGCLRWFLAFATVAAVVLLAFATKDYPVVPHTESQLLGAPAKWIEAAVLCSIIVLVVFATIGSSIDFNLQWDIPVFFRFRRYGLPYTWFDAILMIFVAATLGFVGLAFFANGYFDRSQPQAHWSSIANKDTQHSSRGGDSLTLYLIDWQPNGQIIKMKVNRDVYDSHQIGQQTLVSTKNGFLGYEWIAQLQ